MCRRDPDCVRAVAAASEVCYLSGVAAVAGISIKDPADKEGIIILFGSDISPVWDIIDPLLEKYRTEIKRGIGYQEITG